MYRPLSHTSAGIHWLICSLPHCSSKSLSHFHTGLRSAPQQMTALLKSFPIILWWPQHFYHQQLWCLFIHFNLCLFPEWKPHSRPHPDMTTAPVCMQKPPDVDSDPDCLANDEFTTIKPKQSLKYKLGVICEEWVNPSRHSEDSS